MIIGSRGSALALWQGNWAKRKLEDAHPELKPEIAVIKTQGDRLSETPLSQIGGKEVWTKEIENALLAGRIDLAVHSLKDLPAQLPNGLALGAISLREDVRDVLVSKRDQGFWDLPKGAVLATSSLRRQAQLRHARPDLRFVEMRGNVDTRFKKFHAKNIDGIVLAAAGLKRLGLETHIADYLDPALCLPAPGQGALGIEIRAGDREVLRWIAVLNHAETQRAVTAERAMLAALGGGCRVPIGGLATCDASLSRLRAVVASPDGKRIIRSQRASTKDTPDQLGHRVAQTLLAQGASEILALEQRGDRR